MVVFFMQRPTVVSHTGRSCGQQCLKSSRTGLSETPCLGAPAAYGFHIALHGVLAFPMCILKRLCTRRCESGDHECV